MNFKKFDLLNDEQKKDFVDSCPSKVYKFSEENSQVEIENLDGCTFCDECVKKSKQLGVPDLIQIRPTYDEFIFSFESNGCMPPENILLSAIEELKKKINRVEFNLKKIKESRKRQR